MSNKYPFRLQDRTAKMIVELHQEISAATENCIPKSIPRDIIDIEIALAKSSAVRDALSPVRSIFDNDDNEPDITRIIPRHKIEEQTQFKKRLLLMSASEIDTLPVCAETKAVILGAQVEFVKALRRFQFFRAYDLYKYIRLWNKST